MADNVELPSGSGGAIIATDDDGTAQHQYVKLEFGADNTQTKVSAANPLPVILASNSGVDAADVTVNNGTGTQSVPVQGAAATDAAAAGNPVLIGGEFDDTTPNSVDEGDVGSLRMSANRNLYVSLRDAAGNERGLNVDANGAIGVTGTVELGATDNAVLDAIAADGDAIQTLLGTIDADTSTLAGAVSGTEMQVDVVTSALPTGAATAAKQPALGTAGTPSADVISIQGVASGTVVPVSDGGGSLTIDGTVTANLSATDNAVLDNIDADLTTVIGHVDGIEALLGTIDADTGNAATALQLIDDTVFADDAAFTLASSKVQMAGAIRDDSLSTLTAIEGDAVPLRVSSTGALHVTGGGGGTEYDEDAATPATITGTATMMERDDALAALTPVEGDWVAMRSTAEGALWVQDFNSDAILADTANMDTNLATVAGAVSGTEMQVDVVTSALPTGAATAANQTTIIGHLDGVEGLLTTIDSDTSNLAAIAASLALLDNAIATGNELQVDVVAALPAGDNNIGNVDIASAIPAGTNNIGDVDVASIAAGTNAIGNVGLVGRTSGGMTIFRSIDIDESEEEVKATAGQLFSITAFNTTAAPLYLKFYNLTAANTTVGTSTPVLTFVVPGNADSDGAGFVWNNDIGFAFSTAISVACTTGVADNDTGAPGANACIINLGYA